MNSFQNIKAGKNAIIVEGGGFKSAFTSGILDSFLINKYDPFNLYVGVSAGAMNLTSFISRQYKRNINIISAMSENNNFISIVRFLKGGNYLELKYMIEIASKEYPFMEELANKYLEKSDFRVIVTNYDTGEPEYLSIKKYGWIKLIEATGALPIAIRGYCTLDGNNYIDGGLSDPLPVKQVYDWGYRTILLLRSNPVNMLPAWNIESLYAPYFYKDKPELKKIVTQNDEIYNKGKEYIENPPKDLNIIQLAPENELACGVITSNKNNVKLDYCYGLEIGLDFLSQFRNLN